MRKLIVQRMFGTLLLTLAQGFLLQQRTHQPRSCKSHQKLKQHRSLFVLYSAVANETLMIEDSITTTTTSATTGASGAEDFLDEHTWESDPSLMGSEILRATLTSHANPLGLTIEESLAECPINNDDDDDDDDDVDGRC